MEWNCERWVGIGLAAEWFEAAGDGAFGDITEPFFALLFVDAVVAFAPNDGSIAFEGEYMCGDAIEEPAVVADDDSAATECFESFFEGAEGIDIEVIGGFVEEQEVSAGAEEFGEVDAVAFTAGELSDEFLLVGAFEVKASAVGAGVNFGGADFEEIVSAGNFLVDGFGSIE